VSAKADINRRIYNPRQRQVKNGEIAVFRFIWPELPLFAREGTGI
jgi:ASC-1-like (ASCH) protein